MKVIFKSGIVSLSGNIGGMIFSSFNGGRIATVRSYKKPKESVNQHFFGARKQRISEFRKSCSEGFRKDMRKHTERKIPYTMIEKRPVTCAYAFFISFLYNFAKSVPDLELAAVDKELLVGLGCPVTV